MTEHNAANNPWTDFDTVYEGLTQPTRGGILSERSLRNPNLTVKRVREHAHALAWNLHWAVRDLVSARSWGTDNANEAQRLRDRLTEVFGLLTDDQKAEMLRRDEARRTQHIEV